MREYPQEWDSMVDEVCESENVDRRFKELLIAMACHESGYGESRYARKANNVLNIRCIITQNKEYENGFRLFDSVTDCFRSGVYLLAHSRHYTAAREKYFKTGNIQQFICEAGKVYCPDSEVKGQSAIWSASVSKIFQEIERKKADSTDNEI